MKHKPKPTVRRTTLTALTEEVARDWAHQNSAVIHSKVRVLRCEADETDKSIVALQGALQAAKDRRKKVEATLAGLAVVLEKRS